MDDASHHTYVAWASNNAWANRTFYAAVDGLPRDAFEWPVRR